MQFILKWKLLQDNWRKQSMKHLVFRFNLQLKNKAASAFHEHFSPFCPVFNCNRCLCQFGALDTKTETLKKETARSWVYINAKMVI